MIENKLFLDMDESLIASFYANDENDADRMLEKYGDRWKGVKYKLSEGSGWDGRSSWYVSFLRSWTVEFLQWCKDTYGEEHVNILTMGTADYITKAIKNLELDIDVKNHLFTREDIYYPRHNFEMSNNVLVDNEDYFYHTSGISNKHNYLGGFPPEKLVEIDDFYLSSCDKDKDHVYVDHVKAEIIKAFAYHP